MLAGLRLRTVVRGWSGLTRGFQAVPRSTLVGLNSGAPRFSPYTRPRLHGLIFTASRIRPPRILWLPSERRRSPKSLWLPRGLGRVMLRLRDLRRLVLFKSEFRFFARMPTPPS